MGSPRGAPVIASSTWSQLMQMLEPLLLEGAPGLERNKPAILKLLSSYHSRPSDYQQFRLFDSASYTKNLVRAFGHTSNVIVMCWAPRQQSLFHAHQGSRCFVKVLEGRLLEQQVAHPALHRGGPAAAMRELVLEEDDVNYIDDQLGAHKMINITDRPAVTLHLYLPAYEQCLLFETQPGEHHPSLSMEQSRAVQVTFFSQLSPNNQRDA